MAGHFGICESSSNVDGQLPASMNNHRKQPVQSLIKLLKYKYILKKTTHTHTHYTYVPCLKMTSNVLESTFSPTLHPAPLLYLELYLLSRGPTLAVNYPTTQHNDKFWVIQVDIFEPDIKY